MTAEISGSDRVPTELPNRDVWKSDRVNAFSWAVLFLLGAIVPVASSTTWHESYDWWDGWGVVFIGAGVMVSVAAHVRASVWGWRFGRGSAGRKSPTNRCWMMP